MADGLVQIQPDSTGKKVDTSELTVGANTVERQRMVLADPVTAAGLAAVLNSAPVGTEYAGAVRQVGTAKVDGSGVTQPISATALPLPANAAQDGTDQTGVTSPTGAAGIRGWLSAIYNVLKNGSLSVTGTFFQATQPVSGTFFQATQPVSAAALPLPSGASQDGTDQTGVTSPTGAVGIRGWLSAIFNILKSGSIAVTGTFFQATQPVSGTFFQATQPVSVAAAVTVAQGTAANLNATVTGTVVITPPSLTKGTQGATGLSVQDLKDSGRSVLTFFLDRVTGITTEALATMSIVKGFVNQTAATSYTVTAAKTLRLQSLTVTIEASSTVSVGGRVRIRAAASSFTVASPVLYEIDVPIPIGSATAVAGMGAPAVTIDFPDGLELPAGTIIGMSHLDSATTSTVSVCLVGYEY